MPLLYLDNAATTVVSAEVKEAVTPFYFEQFGNPSSKHQMGTAVRSVLDAERMKVAKIFGVGAADVFFTSGGTEANNLAILGFARSGAKFGRHIVCGPTEHPSVYEAVEQLKKEGFSVSFAKLTNTGSIDLAHLESILKGSTVLVTMMLVNNLYGSVYPLEKIGRLVAANCPHAIFHSDCVQAVGKVPISLRSLRIHSCSISSHKIHGMKGTGALILHSDRPRAPQPLVFGGGQEGFLRPGTENVPGIIGLSTALVTASASREAFTASSNECRALLAGRLPRVLPGAAVLTIPGATGDDTAYVPSIIALKLPVVPAEIWMNALGASDVAVGVGSACQTARRELSPALLALGFDTDEARRVMRLSLAKTSSVDDMKRFLEILKVVASSLIPDLAPVEDVEMEEEVEEEETATAVEESKPEPPALKKRRLDTAEVTAVKAAVKDDPERQKTVAELRVERKQKKREARQRKLKELEGEWADVSDEIPCMILVREGEQTLKSKNYQNFKKVLIKNIRTQLERIGKPVIWGLNKKGRVWIRPHKTEPQELVPEYAARVAMLPGVSSVSPAWKVGRDIEVICLSAEKVVGSALAKTAQTGLVRYRVKVIRSDKTYPIESPKIGSLVAEHLNTVPHLKTRLMVDLKKPELELGVEVQPDGAYLYCERLPGPGGLPVGSSGKAVVLLSGGIDSPVASYRMMVRGLQCSYVSFHSPPYLGEGSQQKIAALVGRLARFQPRAKFYTVPFTEIQTTIRDNCPEEYRTVLYRRMMGRVASRIAQNEGAKALITGEAVGQVASQTTANMTCIAEASDLLILRPLVGENKGDTITQAIAIGTYDLSIRPEPDCCTLFMPKKPVIHGKMKQVEMAEKRLNIPELVEKALKETTHRIVEPDL